MRIYALSDLHVGHAANRETLATMPGDPEGWLILAGDLGERPAHLNWTFELLRHRWRQLVWVPGNHELWTTDGGPRGVARYEALVNLCQSQGVLTPEDPYPHIGDGRYLCPLFLLYDYSFAPDGMGHDEAVAWAAEDGIAAQDEALLFPDPFPDRESWCRHRCDLTEARLRALPVGARTLLVNHWPLRRDLVRLRLVPRYAPWCGTRRTEDWHQRFRADVVISGHLHMRATDWRDGVRFEEVSLGYPRHWRPEVGAAGYLRPIWPDPGASAHGEPVWHP